VRRAHPTRIYKQHERRLRR